MGHELWVMVQGVWIGVMGQGVGVKGHGLYGRGHGTGSSEENTKKLLNNGLTDGLSDFVTS